MSDNTKESPKKTATAADDSKLLSSITKYFKFAAGTLLVWGAGYFRFSPSWLLIGLVVYIWKERHVKKRHRQIKIQQELAQDEQRTILANMEDLPSWVHFPDVERAEWLNKMIDQIWPYIGSYVENLLRTSIQDKVRASHSSVSKFEFTKIDLGDIPPRIGGVKVYTQNVRRDEIYMDLDIIYSSDCLIEVKVKGMTAGIKDLQLRGAIRVIFKPLIGQIPLFGGLTVFFLNNPTIDFNLIGLANAFDLPGLNDIVYSQIQEIVASIMVLPNRIAVPIAEGVNISLIKYPPPEGVLRIYVIEAQKLEKKDISLTGGGKSDPYAVVKVGAHKFETKAKDNTINPVWNSVFEAVIDAKDKQFLDIELFDKDPDKDDKLGNVSMEIANAVSQGTMESWLPLNDAKSGMIRIKLVWMYLANDPLELERQMKGDRSMDDLSSCLLMVNLDSARELPRGKKQMAEPNPYVKLKMGREEFESDVKMSTDSPVWENNFRFLVHNPYVQELECEIYDKKSGSKLGNVTVPLKLILTAPEMTLDQYFNLNNSGTESQINMRIALRVLTPDFNAEYVNTDNLMKATTDKKDEPADQKEAASADQKEAAKAKAPSGDTKNAADKKHEIVVEKSKKVETVAPQGQIIPPASGKTQSKDTDIRQRTVTSSKGAYGHGRIQVTLRYVTQRKSLVVVVHKCMNLIACDDDGLADPYVKLYLITQKSRSDKHKTQIIKNILDPVYDETFEFPVNPTELKSVGTHLEITVRNDTSRFSSNTRFMGLADIDMSTLDQAKAITTWFDLMPEDMEGKIVPITEAQTDV